MSVAIKEIHVQNLGPHTQFSTELGKFNLIFGHNENGKTYLVEFIIRSLFRQSKKRIDVIPTKGRNWTINRL